MHGMNNVKFPSLPFILSQMKLANILPPCIVEDPVCINLTFTPRPSKFSVPFRSFDKICTRF